EREIGVKNHGLTVKSLRRFIVRNLEGRAILQFSPLQIEHISVWVVAPVGLQVDSLLRAQLRLQGVGNVTCELTLQIDRIDEFAVVTLRPDLAPVCRIDQ